MKKIKNFRSKPHEISIVVKKCEHCENLLKKGKGREKKLSVVKIKVVKNLMGKFHEIRYANKGLPLLLSVDPISFPNGKDGILTSAHQKCEIFHYPCFVPNLYRKVR